MTDLDAGDGNGAAVGMPLASSGSTMIVGDPHPRTVIAMNKILRADSQRMLTACEDQRPRLLCHLKRTPITRPSLTRQFAIRPPRPSPDPNELLTDLCRAALIASCREGRPPRGPDVSWRDMASHSSLLPLSPAAVSTLLSGWSKSRVSCRINCGVVVVGGICALAPVSTHPR